MWGTGLWKECPAVKPLMRIAPPLHWSVAGNGLFRLICLTQSHVCVCVYVWVRQAGSSVNQGQRIKIIMIIIKRSQIFTGFSARVARLVLLLVKKHQTVRAVHHLHSYIAMQSISDRETQRFYLILCFSAVGANSINFRVTNSAQKWGRETELEKQDGGWG